MSYFIIATMCIIIIIVIIIICSSVCNDAVLYTLNCVDW